MTLVRPLHFYGVPNGGVHLAMAKVAEANTGTSWHQPTATLRLSASTIFRLTEIHSPPAPLRGRGLLGHRHSDPCQPTHFTQMNLWDNQHRDTANCWLLLAINLEPLPASLYHPA